MSLVSCSLPSARLGGAVTGHVRMYCNSLLFDCFVCRVSRQDWLYYATVLCSRTSLRAPWAIWLEPPGSFGPPRSFGRSSHQCVPLVPDFYFCVRRGLCEALCCRPEHCKWSFFLPWLSALITAEWARLGASSCVPGGWPVLSATIAGARLAITSKMVQEVVLVDITWTLFIACPAPCCKMAAATRSTFCCSPRPAHLQIDPGPGHDRSWSIPIAL